MATLYKCDRCGKVSKKQFSDEIRVEKKNHKNKHQHEWNELDLCDPCQEVVKDLIEDFVREDK